MKRILVFLTAGCVLLSLTSCSLSLLGSPTHLSTPIVLSSPTPASSSPVPAATPTPDLPPAASTLTLPAATPALALPTAAGDLQPTANTGGILPGSPSGPYAVIQVASPDILNIHSAPGADSSVIGYFPATFNSVMRTGPSANVGGDPWVQVQNPGGGNGWVNANYLTEYVAPAVFCADARVNTLLTNFANAVKTSNGGTLLSLVSPSHGMTVRLWRNGNAIVFDQAHAQWIFSSTYEHDWGAAPGSGQDTLGAIHVVVLPKWLDVLNAPAPGYTLSCNVPETGGASYDTSWPAAYTNINFYSLYKPSPAGNELSWRTLLVGVEYVRAQLYIFSVTQLDWEP